MTDTTENGKYYIPTIEEFHVGFEYEALDSFKFILPPPSDEDWSKRVFGIHHARQVAEINICHTLISNNGIRVKRLDSDDIVECGFSKAINDGEYVMRTEKENIWLCVHHDKSLTIQRRITGMLEADISGIFIRNKNELKRIMRQIGITDAG